MSKKILILRFSSIGDIILTTPVMRCLKHQFPDYKVHYATKERFKGLLMNNPNIDKLHLLKDSSSDFISELKKEKFDLILDLHNNIRTANIWSQLRVKRHKVDKINWEKWLMVKLKINILPYQHIVDRYIETGAGLGLANDGRGLDYIIPSTCNIERFNIPKKYVVYAIGGQHETKKLPLNKQLELLSKIELPVVLIGGKEDEARGDVLSQKFKAVYNCCGKMSIDESAKAIEGCETLYTHDTGMMHIGAALKRPIVSIWGNTIPEFGMYPYYPETYDDSTSKTIEVKDLSCRPCSKIGYKECPKGHFDCMNLINFNDM